MTVAKKMIWMTSLAIFGIVSLLGITQYEIEKVYQTTNYVNTNITPSIALISDMQLKFNTLRIRLANHVITDDASKLAGIEQAIRDIQQSLNTSATQYQSFIADAADRDMLEKDQAALQVYFDKMQPILAASRANNKASAKQLYIDIRATAEAANAVISAHIQKKTSMGNVAANDAATMKQAAILRAIAMGIAICLVVGLFAFFTTRKLVQQLGGEPDQAVAIANQIAVGHLDIAIDIAGKNPHSLMAAMHHMQATLKNVIEEQIRVAEANKQGDIDAHMDTSRFAGSYQVMAENINMMAANQAQIMRKVVTCIDQFSTGDFDQPLEAFTGKRAFINQGVERLRTQVQTFIAEMQLMSAQHDAGNIDQKIDTTLFEGAYRQMAEGVNRMVFEHVQGHQQAIQVVQAFGQGDLTQPLPRFPGKKAYVNDAIEQVRENLQRLIASLNDMSRAHDAGEIDARMHSESFAGAYQTMADGVNKMVAGHIDLNRQVISVVQAFGEGAFHHPLTAFPGKKAINNQAIETVRQNLKALSQDAAALAEAARVGEVAYRADANRHKGEFRSIIEGVNHTLDRIVEPIRTVKTASETIRTAINEIAAGNQNLSQRTEQQANTLAQTASHLDTLANTVAQNADNAKQANQLAARASGIAIHGGEVVNDVVVTMSAINQSAQKIEDIIAVIDGIAFQTNILALNAAVEAARAGEQGRGFAVVAGEVGNLAQRSSMAAREIKALIADSVQKTAEGSRLVENAGTTMHEVVSAVKQVATIIGEISSASTEQTKGISGVNQAVNQMDDATQQNAALVEEAAAAAQSLVDQADQLSIVINQFKLTPSSPSLTFATGTHG